MSPALGEDGRSSERFKEGVAARAIGSARPIQEERSGKTKQKQRTWKERKVTNDGLDVANGPTIKPKFFHVLIGDPEKSQPGEALLQQDLDWLLAEGRIFVEVFRESFGVQAAKGFERV